MKPLAPPRSVEDELDQLRAKLASLEKHVRALLVEPVGASVEKRAAPAWRSGWAARQVELVGPSLEKWGGLPPCDSYSAPSW